MASVEADMKVRGPAEIGGDLYPFSIPPGSVLAAMVAAARADTPMLRADRRAFHRIPELGWREIRTTERIVRALTDLGYDVVAGRKFLGDVPRLGLDAHEPGSGDTGCVAALDCPRAGPSVCVRVDIDALPIREASDHHRPAAEGFGSTDPNTMHACGHDGHIAIGLGLARLLKPRLRTARGRLKLLFQPAEEGLRGARSVVNAGWLDDVDVFLSLHIGLDVPSGTVALNPTGFLASRKFRATLRGIAAHAGKAPQAGRNALLAACQVVLGLHALAQSSEPGVRLNVGRLNSGQALNIVPNEAELAFEVRAEDQLELDRLTERAMMLLSGTASAHGVECASELIGEGGSWVNDPTLVELAGQLCRAGAIFQTHLVDHRFGASDDATVMAQAVAARGGKAAYFVLGADLADGHHTPHFDFDEGVLSEGVALIAALVLSAMDGWETPDS